MNVCGQILIITLVLMRCYQNRTEQNRNDSNNRPPLGLYLVPPQMNSTEIFKFFVFIMLVLHFTDCITVKYFEDLLNFQQQNGSCFFPKCGFAASGHTYFLLLASYFNNYQNINFCTCHGFSYQLAYLYSNF